MDFQSLTECGQRLSDVAILTRHGYIALQRVGGGRYSVGWVHGPWTTANFGGVGHTAFGPANNWPVSCLLILRKLVKLVPPPDVRF